MSSIGEFTLPTRVEEALIEVYKNWTPTYLREVERKTGREFQSLPEIVSYRAADTMGERFPEQAIPACQIELTTSVEMETRANSMSMLLNGAVDVLVQSTEPEAVRELAQLYAFVLGLSFLQKFQKESPVPVSSIAWEKYGVPAVGNPDGRWLAMGSVDIKLLVPNVAEPLKGPIEPDEQEPPNYPVSSETKLNLEAVPPPDAD